MKTVKDQKDKLEQKKNRLAAEETRLKIKERKMRTRHLIEVGGLIVKAELDHLPTNTLYGALLSLKNALAKNESIHEEWTNLGKSSLDTEEKGKTAIILKLELPPTYEIKSQLRNNGLKWNSVRQEWYGYVLDIDTLKEALKLIEYKIEILK